MGLRLCGSENVMQAMVKEAGILGKRGAFRIGLSPQTITSDSMKSRAETKLAE
jgi:hypothetical protein